MRRFSVVSFLVLGGMAGACASQQPYVEVTDLPPPDPVQRIRTGDTISVLVKDQTQLSGSFVVQQNGAYAQPLVGEVSVAGLPPQQVATELAQLLRGIVVKPLVSVSISQRRPLVIPVLGEVRSGGSITLPAGESMLSLLARAGGLTEYARKGGIFVVREKPKLIRIRFDYDLLVGADPKSLQFEFQEGDVVVVE